MISSCCSEQTAVFYNSLLTHSLQYRFCECHIDAKHVFVGFTLHNMCKSMKLHQEWSENVISVSK